MIGEEFDLQPLLQLRLRLKSIDPDGDGDGDGDIADRSRRSVGSCPLSSIVQL